MCFTPRRLVEASGAVAPSRAIEDDGVAEWNNAEDEDRSRMACSPEDSEEVTWAFVVPPATEDGEPQQDELLASSLLTLERPLEELQILLHQESTAYPVCPNYLSSLSSAKLSTRDSGEEWRKKLCEWCFEVADHFEYDREVVTYALHYLDRTVAFKTAAHRAGTNNGGKSSGDITKRGLQLVAVTSLYLAVKLHGEMNAETLESTANPRGGGRFVRRKLGIHVFVQLGRHFFTIQDIEDMERSILASLQWKMNPPTCLQFLHPLLDLCPAWEEEEGLPEGSATVTSVTRSAVLGGMYDVARYLTELSVCTSTLALDHAVSTTSVAAVLCALEALHPTLPLPAHVRGTFLLRMAHATGLTASDDAVRLANKRLQALCPNLFPTHRRPTAAPVRNNNDDEPQHHHLPHVIVPSSPCRATAATTTAPSASGILAAATTPSSLLGRNVSPVSLEQELLHTTASPDNKKNDDHHPTHSSQASPCKRVRHS